MAFDFDGAEAAGLSQEAILKELEKSGKVGYDFTGARKAGISTNEIYSTIKTKMSQPADLPDELPDVVPGPPEEYDNGLVGETSVGEITVLPETNTIPENQQLDLQTTATSQPMIGEKGQLTTITDLPMSMEEEAARRASGPTGIQAAQASGLQQPAEGIAYRDPKTGEVVSTATQAGGIEPAYDILFGPGGKLGTFGILTPQAGVEAGKIVGKKSLEVAQAIDDLFQQHPAAGLGDALSKEAKYILNRNPNITEDQVLEALQGVKTEDQAYALSRMLGETGYIRQAIRADSDAAAGALRADLEVARDKILQTVGTVDIAHAKAKYADMVQAVAGDYQNVHNASPILQDLDFLERFYGVTPSAGNRVVTQMKATLGENPNINLSDALEFRADLNHLISKATRGKEKVKLNSIKENLDGFINSVATPEQKTLIDDAIGTYARTMQNRDVLELVERNTKDGIAVNWTKLHRDLNEANLRSPEAVDALRIAEAFSKRFGNDKKLLNIAMPQGSSPDSGGVLGAWGYVINHLKDTLAIYGNRAENLKIQKAILKSIKSGTTNLDFVNKLKANSDVPEEVSKIFEDLLQIPYKAGARQTGDVNLEPIVTPVGGTEKVVTTDDVIKAPQEKLDEISKLDKDYMATGGPLKPASRGGNIDEVFTSNVENKVDTNIDYSDYADAIEEYTGTSYASANRLMRQGGQSKHKVINFLEKAPENFEGGVYRGTRLKEDQQKALDSLSNGDVLSNLSPLSTSTSRKVATDFVKGEVVGKKKPTLLTIVGKGHDLGKRSNSSEEEVLMKPGKFFTIVDKFTTDSQVHISLKEITEAEAKGKKINKSILALPAAVGLSQMKQNEDK